MANDVKGSVNITIGANADVLNKVFDQAQKRANSFVRNLAEAAAFGAAAFVTLKEGVFGTVEAFSESEAAAKRLDAALLNQGIQSDELRDQYQELADQLTQLTGIDDDAAVSMFAAGQAFLGTTEITSELTTAVANLSAGMGIDLQEAFDKVTKTIGTSTNALAKQGIAVTESMTKQERMAAVIDQINSRYAGQAEAAQTVGTSIKALGVQFGNLREDLGARFAPVVEKVTQSLTGLITQIRSRPELLDFIANAGLLATTLSGVISIFVALKGIIVAMAPVFNLLVSLFSGLGSIISWAGGAITGLIIRFGGAKLIMGAIANASVLVGSAIAALTSPIGIAVAAITALVGGGYLLISNWEAVKNAAKSAGSVIGGVFDVISGTLSNDQEKIGAGLDKITNAFKSKTEEIQKSAESMQWPDMEKGLPDVNALNRANAAARAKEEAERQAHAERLQEIERNKTEALLLQNKIGTKAQIDLKNQESAILKQIDDESANAQSADRDARLRALNQMLADNYRLQQEAKVEHEQRMAEIESAFAEATAEAKALGFDADMELTNQQREQLYGMALTEKEAKRQVGFEMVKDQVDRNNQFLIDQAKYGESYAKVNRALHSQEVKIAGEAADQLVGLTQSKNKTLATIGKAAAVTQIGIDSAQGAASIFAKLNSLIPLLAPGIGAVGAAAILAFGAERSAQVLAANTGGVVPGSGPNVDSIAAMLSPGELVVPRQNFDEVVGAVRESRDGNGNADVVEAINGLSSRLEARPSLIIQGDMLTDDVFVDRLIAKISDRLEFGNARLVGVNA